MALESYWQAYVYTPTPRNNAGEEKGIPMRVTYKDQSILEKQTDRISLAKTAVRQIEKGGK